MEFIDGCCVGVALGAAIIALDRWFKQREALEAAAQWRHDVGALEATKQALMHAVACLTTEVTQLHNHPLLRQRDRAKQGLIKRGGKGRYVAEDRPTPSIEMIESSPAVALPFAIEPFTMVVQPHVVSDDDEPETVRGTGA